ncbi:tetratricopeptide repeat protein [Steroidobacter sp. S1-65]|uniref:Tetratricopeptide repeat protein n=1 Tax=Steroidobacter gossypii TaxID=2805490 RepID=A0ABS1X261_9GAMM|nr:tetratricopeptide repeat protein [Steroidobacter gossypii]MBM0107321.1 tetratricopeptide repeat protein [Steroidobacter gossypii]
MTRGASQLRMLIALTLSSAIAVPAFSAEPRTIRDLDRKEVKVKPDPPSDVKAQQAIEQYRRFLEMESQNERLKAEAMRRLGDLQVEVDEGERADENAFGGLGVDEAVQLYEGLLKGYPNYERNDNVMYQLARAYGAKSQPEKALAVLDQLVTTYPRSEWFIESQFRRGEILFSMGRYRDAENAYIAVTTPGADTGFFEQGLYKLGWSLFKQSRGDESVSAFLRMLDRVLVQDGRVRERDSLSRPERELTDDALRAIAITYSDLDGPESLDAALAERGDPPYAHQLYEALGNLYIEKERYQDAALAYEAFAKRRPDDRFAPSLQVRTIEAYAKGGFASLVIEGKQAFVERYAFGSAFWRERSVSDAPEVAAQLKSNQKDLAEYFYALAQKDKKPENYAAAARWYRAMLDSFPQDAEVASTRFTLGEVLFESGRFAEAAREYETTAYDYPPHAKSAAAGYAALVAYQKHEPSLQGESKALWHRQGIESALMFATSFPEHPESARVQTKADEDLFALNDFDRVIEVSTLILERTPPVDRKFQRTATTLLAHSLFDRGRFAEAESAYVRVQGFLPANDPDRAGIEERIAASIYKQAEAKRTAGDATGAVDDFLRVAALAPNSKARSNAEYDAASILLQNKQWDRAAQVLEAFRKTYPNHELVPDATRSLAVAYLELGRGTQAAAELERVAARAEESVEVRRAALWQAAELYENSASPTNAGRLYASYVKQFPSPLDPAMDARQKLADMAKAQNDLKTRSQWLDEIIRADKSAGAARTDRSKYLAAKATIETADQPAAIFQAVKLTAPLNKSLKLKRNAMEKTLAIYGQALDYGVAEVTTQATFGMAELYRQLGADLMASERPKELDADAREQYDVLLEEQAFPFEEKAIELHETNAQRTGDGVYDQWVQRSFDVLAKLVPARYARTEISEDYVSTLP